MANVLVEKQSLVDAANAIRTVKGTQALIAPEDFDTEILGLAPVKDYGTLTIANYTTTGEVTTASYCTATLTDADSFLSFLIEKGLLHCGFDTTAMRTEYGCTLNYTTSNGGGWYDNNSGSSNGVYTSEQLTAAGLTVVKDTSYSYGTITVEYTVTISSPRTQIKITDSMDFASLGILSTKYEPYGGMMGGEYPPTFTVNGSTRLRSAIIGYVAGDDVSVIPDAFLTCCDNLESIDFTGVTEIKNYCLYYCGNFNGTITFPSSVTTIGDYFMSDCRSFNHPVIIPSTVTSFGTYFLTNCDSLNSTVTVQSSYPTLNYFLYGCNSFNQPFTIPQTVTNVYGLLGGCATFNQPLTIPNGVTNVSQLLASATSFNQPLTIPGSVTNTDYLLQRCSSFNSTLTFSEGITSLGTYILNTATVFNKPIVLPSSITSIGNYFLPSCPAFNSNITLPSGLKTIGNYFLSNNTVFNKPINLQSVESIGTYFLYSCTSFNQNITLPSTLTSIGTYFFYNTNAMTSTITANCNATVAATGNYMLATTSSSAACYTTGIKVGGTYGSAWRSQFANRTSSPYRKLIAA